IFGNTVNTFIKISFCRFQTFSFSFNKIRILQCGTLCCAWHFAPYVVLYGALAFKRWPPYNFKRWPPMQNLIKQKFRLQKSTFSFIENSMHFRAHANEPSHIHMPMYIITPNT
ncbi:hypothetical protein CUMW_166210, partial [Citrus unshiu]